MTQRSTPRLKVHSFLELTQPSPLRNAALPQVAVLGLGVDGTGDGEWFIRSGDTVEEEQVIGRGPHGKVFSPIPGRVVRITEFQSPDGTTSTVAAILLEGAFKRTGKAVPAQPWEDWSPSRVFEMLDYYGYMATASSLEPPFALNSLTRVRRVIVNLLQPEPYQSNWYHLARDEAEALFTGIRILKKLYSPEVFHFALHRHPRDYAAGVLSRFGSGTFEVTWHDQGYPSAHGKLLSTDPSTLILDAESLVGLAVLVQYARPQVETFVTVSGSGVRHPGVYRVRVGTPVSALLEECGLPQPDRHRIILGGPFRGYHLERDAMVTRLTRSILVLGSHETRLAVEQPCVRCGACVDFCPVGINPVRLHEGLNKSGDRARLAGELERCLECGICSAVCPSRIPLLNHFQTARRAQ